MGSGPRFIGKVTKLPTFDGEASKIREFVIVCKLHIRMKIKEKSVEEQVQWVLIYIQEKFANIQKNILEDLEAEEIEFATAEEFLKEFRGNNKLVKVAELKRIEQDSRNMKKFI